MNLSELKQEVSIAEKLIEISLIDTTNKKVGDILAEASRLPSGVSLYAVGVPPGIESEINRDIFIELLKRFIDYINNSGISNFQVIISGIHHSKGLPILEILERESFADYGIAREGLLRIGCGEQ